jgi:CubicO group peptidase (beta-lactamase class C family)
VVPYDPARPAKWFSGNGGLRSTAADYARFSQMILNEGPYFWADPVEKLTVVFMLQELNIQIRTRYRALLRGLVYQALR